MVDEKDKDIKEIEDIVASLITTKEAAKLLKLNVGTVLKFAREEKIECIKFGYTYRFNKKSILDFLKKKLDQK